MPARPEPSYASDVLLEFFRVGNLVKVSAVDPVTMTEVCIQASGSTEERVLREVAIRKLQYVLQRRKVVRPGAGCRSERYG